MGRRVLSFAVCSFHRETFQLVLIAAKNLLSAEAESVDGKLSAKLFKITFSKTPLTAEFLLRGNLC